ncbi:hypothetical protein GCM10023192_88740 [Amycolatopsis samaneae]
MALNHNPNPFTAPGGSHTETAGPPDPDQLALLLATDEDSPSAGLTDRIMTAIHAELRHTHPAPCFRQSDRSGADPCEQITGSSSYRTARR